jgi:tRNA(Leu) C34 or U34 (ribose-2'-O)-methylase TrmL
MRSEGRPPAIALIDPKYSHNVGAAVRAASCFGVGQVWYTGERVSLTPTGGRRLPREERMRGYKDVELRQVEPGGTSPTGKGRGPGHARVFDAFARSGAVPVAVELRRGAELLPAFEHPERALYVFGPEDGNLTSAVLARCHRVVAIPTRHCVNLAAAVYLVLYDRMVKRQASGLEPAVPLASALADDRGWLEPDSMAPDVGVEPGR